jgi:hypothetical protein
VVGKKIRRKYANNEDQGVDVRMLCEWHGSGLTGIRWLRMWTSDGLFVNTVRNFGIHKTRKTSVILQDAMHLDEGLLHGATSVSIYFTFTSIHCHSAQVFVTRITVTGTLIAIPLQLITKLSDIPSTAHSIDSHRSSICLKFLVLTVHELWKQNFLPAAFTQPTLQVTKFAYLVRKQWCAASWLSCFRILILGRPTQSKPRTSELNKGKWEPNYTNKRWGTSIGSGTDLYSVKYPPRNSAQAKRYPNWEDPWVCSATPGKFRDSVSNQTMTASYIILSNSLLTYCCAHSVQWSLLNKQTWYQPAAYATRRAMY